MTLIVAYGRDLDEAVEHYRSQSKSVRKSGNLAVASSTVSPIKHACSRCNAIALASAPISECPSCNSLLESPMSDVFCVSAPTYAEAQMKYANLISGAITAFASSVDGRRVISDEPINHNGWSWVSDEYDSEEIEPHEVQTAFASNDEDAPISCYVSPDNDEFVISNDPTIVFSMATGSTLEDPSGDALAEVEQFNSEGHATSVALAGSGKSCASNEGEDYDEDDEDDDEDDEDDEFESIKFDDEPDLTLALSSNADGRLSFDPDDIPVARQRGGAIPRNFATASGINRAKTNHVAGDHLANKLDTLSNEDAGLLNGQTVTAKMLAVAHSSINPADVQLVHIGALDGDDRWLAFHKGTPFAYASARDNNVEMFNNPRFGEAVQAVMREQGVSLALAQHGFKDIMVEANIPEHVSSTIQREVDTQAQEIAANYQARERDLEARFSAALSLAANGMAQDMWPEIRNPIRDTLIQALASAGMQGASEMVNEAFARNGEAYHEGLISKAFTLMSYDPKTHNELASMIKGRMATASNRVDVGRAVPNIAQPQVAPVAQFNQGHGNLATASSSDDFNAKLSAIFPTFKSGM